MHWVLFFSGIWALGFCHACEWRHERSVGANCIHFKKAMEKCKQLGVPTEDYKPYPPDLEGTRPSSPVSLNITILLQYKIF